MTPLLTVSEVAELSLQPSRRFNGIAQLVKDWNRDPSRRSLMISEGPKSGSIAHRTALAAIVRCLCARDRIPLPNWVTTYGPLDEPFALSGESLEGPMGDFVCSYTPSIAASLGVFFDRALLESR